MKSKSFLAVLTCVAAFILPTDGEAASIINVNASFDLTDSTSGSFFFVSPTVSIPSVSVSSLDRIDGHFVFENGQSLSVTQPSAFGIVFGPTNASTFGYTVGWGFQFLGVSGDLNPGGFGDVFNVTGQNRLAVDVLADFTNTTFSFNEVIFSIDLSVASKFTAMSFLS